MQRNGNQYNAIFVMCLENKHKVRKDIEVGLSVYKPHIFSSKKSVK